MRRSVVATAVTSVGVLVGSALVTASPAAASTTWIQSVQRPSAEAACPTSSGPAAQSGWVVTEWAKSWEEWPNGGTGGWTCTRSITWGNSGGERTPSPVDTNAPASPPGVGCISENGSGGYINFLGGFFLEAGARAYTNSSCTSFSGTYSNPRIYAPAGFDAVALCAYYASRPYANGPYGDNTWDCDTEPDN